MQGDKDPAFKVLFLISGTIKKNCGRSNTAFTRALLHGLQPKYTSAFAIIGRKYIGKRIAIPKKVTHIYVIKLNFALLPLPLRVHFPDLVFKLLRRSLKIHERQKKKKKPMELTWSIHLQARKDK